MRQANNRARRTFYVPDDEMTTEEAAQLLKCSQRTIQRMIERGSLNARTTDPSAQKATFRLSRADVEALRRAQLTRPALHR